MLEHNPRPTAMRSHRLDTRSPAAVLLAQRSGCPYGGLRRRRGEGDKGGGWWRRWLGCHPCHLTLGSTISIMTQWKYNIA
jgi:hypothetical protein